MILSGEEIASRMGKDIIVEPFHESRLNPNSYNLSLHDELMIYNDLPLDMKKNNSPVSTLALRRDGTKTILDLF